MNGSAAVNFLTIVSISASADAGGTGWKMDVLADGGAVMHYWILYR
jgi:hypothetical protein